MADPHIDAKLAQRYREIATEQPSAVLDAAIRAAAHRSVASAPGGFRAGRWAIPASIAAVLVLSFGVTLRMQQEQPGIAMAPPAREPPQAPVPAETPKPTLREEAKPAESIAPKPPPAKPVVVPDKKLAAAPERVQDAPRAPAKPVSPQPFPAAPSEQRAPSAPATVAPAAPPPPAMATIRPPVADAMEAGRRNETEATVAKERSAAPFAQGASVPAPAPRAKTEAAEARRDAPALGRIEPETPEKKLERIAELRRAGRHADADEALARFRREHADYRITPEIWERVKPR